MATSVHAAITEAVLSLDAVVARVASPGHGAIASFLGVVREHHLGRAVTGIDYEAYGPMALAELTRVANEVAGRIPGVAIAVEHRTGTLAVGEASVAIAAGHAHRAEALAAVSLTLEELKRRVPIWKREHYADGTREWVDPTTSGATASAGAAGAPATATAS